MAVPKEYQALFSRWCADRVPGHARASLQIGYTIHGDSVTIVERHPPAFPELSSAWSTAHIAQLRYNDPEQGLWRIYRRVGDKWERYDHSPATMPEPLLAEIVDDTHSVFWG
ncbi:MAG TPA: DUF3024 domain-containing protein [Pseudonocardia sp.]|nr:DUF3024 domain-containing protein [Pseudonocardia sp.]